MDNAALTLKTPGDQTPGRIVQNNSRERAWRNLMVAAINAALDLKIIGLREDENYWPGMPRATATFPPGVRPVTEDHRPVDWNGGVLFDFEIAGLPATGWLGDIGWGELSIHAAVMPIPDRGLHAYGFSSGAMFWCGDAVAYGWLERRLGAWLMTSGSFRFACRRRLLPVIAGLDIPASGYADHGRFIF